MKKAANIIVEKRRIVLAVFLLLTLASGWLATKVAVNSDMTKYLPEDSAAKAGLEVMAAEFPAANSLHVMFKGLSENEKTEVYSRLSGLENVQSVSWEAGSERYNRDDYTLYTVSMSCGAYSAEAKAVVAAIDEQYSELSMSGEAAGMKDLSFIFIPALGILLVVLVLMSKSWFEPLILLANIGVAVIINMGTNAIFDSVSEITQAIAAILQLVLSMDYSIMLINRYRQEKEHTDNKYDAMKQALQGAFTAISSSSVTTIVGMFMLVFMSFTIGMDLGLVIAKGVFFSLLCVFTVMPALVVMSDRMIEKTAKPTLNFKMGKAASFAYKARYVMLALFAGLFAFGFAFRGEVSIGYTINAYDDVYQIFTLDNPIVILYENNDEEKISALAEKWKDNEFVDSVNAYATTLGLSKLTPAEFMAAMGMDESMVGLLKQFVGSNYSRLIINTSLGEESDEAFELVAGLGDDLNGTLSGEYFLLGNSAMAYEMAEDFPRELNFITILTAVSIFLVVMIAFRSLSVPLILVLLIQCAVYITMGSAYIQGSTIYYLALLIVQCLMMGATIDYGLLYTSNYREARETESITKAMVTALNHTMHTVMTSGLILLTVTLVLGILLAGQNYAVSEILLIIARGCFIAIILVVFILPSLLAVFDRFVVKKK